jgi:hypothetical protein
LVALCNRMQESDNRHCSILFCDERASADEAAPASSRRNAPAPAPPRAYH